MRLALNYTYLILIALISVFSVQTHADWKDSLKNFLNKPSLPVGESSIRQFTIINLLKMQSLLHSHLADKSEQAMLANVLDFGFEQKDMEFSETYLVITNEEIERKLGPMTMGEALVENDRLHRKLEPQLVIAYIETDIAIEQKPLGRFQIAWHPSKSFYLLASSLIYYPMDRAYLSPKYLREKFPEYYKPEYHTEQFKITKVSDDSFHLGLNVNLTYHGDPVSNKTIFNLDLSTDEKTILPCKSQLETDYNPSAPVFHIKGNLSCLGLIANEGLK